MLLGEAALVGAEQPALEQARDAMNGWHRDVRRISGLGLVRDLVLVAELIEVVVALVPVGEDRRARLARIGDEVLERLCLRVWHDAHPHAPEALNQPSVCWQRGQEKPLGQRTRIR